MYHIPNDKRARQSAELIFAGLLKCIKRKSFDYVSITDLQRETGVARSTFYRLFDNISDILYWKCDVCFKEVLNSDFDEILFNEFDFAEHYFSYWLNHSEILELIIKIGRQDIIYDCHIKNAEDLRRNHGKTNDPKIKNGDYFMAVRTSFTIGILTAWLRNGKKETPEELLQIIKEQLALLYAGAVQANLLIFGTPPMKNFGKLKRCGQIEHNMI